MNTLDKLKYKYNQDGFVAVIAGVLRQAANSLDGGKKQSFVNQPSKEFLSWIRMAVPGMLEPGNLSAMEYAVCNMPTGSPVVEIGSFCGLSSVIVSYLLEKHDKESVLFCCDKWEFEGQKLGMPLGDSKSVTHDDYQSYVKESYKRSMRTFASCRLPFAIECFSDEFFNLWGNNENVKDVFDRPIQLGGDIGFCFIDGNHTYEFARRDFENTDRSLLPGGFILFDDSADNSPWEVNRLTREIAKGSTYDLVMKNPNYLFRKK